MIRRYEEMVRSYGKHAKPTVSEPMTKAERWQQQQNLIGRGERSPYPDAQLASKRLAANNITVENAKLSENVYKTTNPLRDTPYVPEGWKDISNDESALTKLGLNSKILYDNEQSPNYLARVYQPDSRIFGKVMNPTVVFRGSRAPEFAEGTGETVKKSFLTMYLKLKI